MFNQQKHVGLRHSVESPMLCMCVSACQLAKIKFIQKTKKKYFPQVSQYKTHIPKKKILKRKVS